MPESVHKEQLQSLPKVVVERLKAAIGDKHVLTDRDELFVYEADALTIHKYLPSAVVIPGTAEEVAAAVKILAAAEIPFTPRGAGTDRKSTRLNSSHTVISYAVFCLKKKKKT